MSKATTLQDILKAMYYKGKDGEGLSDYELTQATKQINSMLVSARKEKTKELVKVYEMIFGEFSESNMNEDVIVPSYVKARVYYAIKEGDK
jgi:hypothetical protein